MQKTHFVTSFLTDLIFEKVNILLKKNINTTTVKINVCVKNTFRLIKKFQYSNHKIFLRKLISKGTYVTLKLKHLTIVGEINVEYRRLIIDIKIDKEGRKILILLCNANIGLLFEFNILYFGILTNIYFNLNNCTQ